MRRRRHCPKRPFKARLQHPTRHKTADPRWLKQQISARKHSPTHQNHRPGWPSTPPRSTTSSGPVFKYHCRPSFSRGVNSTGITDTDTANDLLADCVIADVPADRRNSHTPALIPHKPQPSQPTPTHPCSSHTAQPSHSPPPQRRRSAPTPDTRGSQRPRQPHHQGRRRPRQHTAAPLPPALAFAHCPFLCPLPWARQDPPLPGHGPAALIVNSDAAKR